MRVRRLSAPLGAIVEDIDVRRIDAGQWRTLNDLFCEHHALSFPDQHLTPETRWRLRSGGVSWCVIRIRA